MAKPLESAIEHMERLEVALLVAEAKLKAMNAKAQVNLDRMRAEIAVITSKFKSRPGMP
jgi:hypothetical protein